MHLCGSCFSGYIALQTKAVAQTACCAVFYHFLHNAGHQPRRFAAHRSGFVAVGKPRIKIADELAVFIFQ